MKRSLMALMFACVVLVLGLAWAGGLTGELVQPSPLCRDSDGDDFFYHGKVLAQSGSQQRKIYSDYCGTSGVEAGQLVEYLCAPDQSARKYLFDCPYGCYAGRCQEIPASEIGKNLR
ncbi:MAG TPA: hypothetical protein VJH22_04155 [Candidatus Nanoarchaeia archaeon]|nr:hypothetical protein [Candidatus Nanoarchaeia archaeon]